MHLASHRSIFKWQVMLASLVSMIMSVIRIPTAKTCFQLDADTSFESHRQTCGFPLCSVTGFPSSMRDPYAPIPSLHTNLKSHRITVIRMHRDSDDASVHAVSKRSTTSFIQPRLQTHEKLPKIGTTASPFPHSLHIDEGTDRRGKCQLVGCVRYILGWRIYKRIVFCKEFKVEKTGEAITVVVRELIQKYGKPWSKLGAISTDGCMTNYGPKIGVIARLRRYNPDISDTSCYIHRFALCIKSFQAGLKSATNTIQCLATYFGTR